MNRIRNGAIAAVVGALGVTIGVPAHASTPEADACRIMGPQYIEGVRECVCTLVVPMIGDTPLPDQPWVCG